MKEIMQKAMFVPIPNGIIDMILDANTVEAIPIEWIEQWGSQNGMSESMSLAVMIEDWRKENEI